MFVNSCYIQAATNPAMPPSPFFSATTCRFCSGPAEDVLQAQTERDNTLKNAVKSIEKSEHAFEVVNAFKAAGEKTLIFS